MFSLLMCLRLLRVNITHMITWNVALHQCGFPEDGVRLTKMTAAGTVHMCILCGLA